MLQKEGLISEEPNYRSRVLGFDPEVLELLYVSRIMNEGISAAIIVQKMKDGDIDKVETLLARMRQAEERQNFNELARDISAILAVVIFWSEPETTTAHVCVLPPQRALSPQR